jgi:hypothetical protein
MLTGYTVPCFITARYLCETGDRRILTPWVTNYYRLDTELNMQSFMDSVLEILLADA